jgi:hypothetical protein
MKKRLLACFSAAAKHQETTATIPGIEAPGSLNEADQYC